MNDTKEVKVYYDHYDVANNHSTECKVTVDRDATLESIRDFLIDAFGKYGLRSAFDIETGIKIV